MTFSKQVEALVSAAEAVVDQCLIPVPSLPLFRLGEQCVALESDESDERDNSEDHPIWALASVCEDVDWSFWPQGEYSSRRALVDSYRVQELADALQEYRKSIAESVYGVVRD